jgi:hypothetical protein
MISAVSVALQPVAVHIAMYVPGAVNPLMVVLGNEAELIPAAAGLDEGNDQVPAPVASIVATPYSQIVWSGPALALPTITLAVSVLVQPADVQTKP